MQRYIRESAKRLAFNRAHFINSDSFFGKKHQLQLSLYSTTIDKKFSPNTSSYLHSDQDVHLMKANCNEQDGGFAIQFEFPDSNGLSLHSVSFDSKDNTPMLTFEAANPFDSPSLTEQDVAVMAKLAMEGRRPEFVFKSILPGHLLHGRQYKHYSPSWIKGTSIGDLLFEADWAMKCLSIGSKSNKEKTKFCSRQRTSKLPGLATQMDFPSCKQAGSIFMSCKSVTVEETDECLMFVGDPVMAITDDVTPAYGDYITAHYDSVAYYDEPLFLKMKELIKLIVGMEWLVKKGIKFNQEWISRHVKENKPPQSQAVELYKGKSLCTSQGKQEICSLFPPSHFPTKTLCSLEITITSDVLPIRLQLVNVPNFESLLELFNETVPWPKVSLQSRETEVTIQSSLGGISTSNIPVTSVATTAVTAAASAAAAVFAGVPLLGLPLAMKPRNPEPATTAGPYLMTDNEVTVKGSESVHKTTKPLRRRDKPTKKQYKVPPKDVKNNTDIARRNGTAKTYKTFGASDSNESFSENGERLVKPQGKNYLTSTKAELQFDESDTAPKPSSATEFHGNERHPESSSNLSYQPPKEDGAPKPSSPPFDMTETSNPASLSDEQTVTHDTSSPLVEVEIPPASTPYTRFTTQHDTEASSKPMPQLYNDLTDDELIPTPSSPTSFDISLMEHESLSKSRALSPTDSGYSTQSCSSFGTTNNG